MRFPGGSIFSPPKPPSLPPPQPVPTPADPAIEEAKRRERLAAQRRKGRAALVLAGEAGDLGAAVGRGTGAPPNTTQLLGG
jgi:hypothetical protein